MIPEVSILIPIYNVSDYIEKCAHSLFKQTFLDIEYVFVNDCTPDDSIEKLLNVIDQYPHRKDQVKIINHDKNRGSAVARNTAIENSTGRYTSVVDSDDYIESDMIQVLYTKAIESGADIVVSDFIFEYSSHSVIRKDHVSENKDENFLNMLEQEKTYCSLCNKLILRELYEKSDCRFKEGLNYSEDRQVMTRLYFYANRIVKINKAFYHYIQYNSSSITKTKNRMHFENVILFWEEIDNFLIEKGLYEKYRLVIELSKVRNKARLMIDIDLAKIRKEYAKMFSKFETKYFKQLKLSEKVMLQLVRYRFFKLTQVFKKFLVYRNK